MSNASLLRTKYYENLIEILSNEKQSEDLSKYLSSTTDDQYLQNYSKNLNKIESNFFFIYFLSYPIIFALIHKFLHH